MGHVPVLLAEVAHAFATMPIALRRLADCTIGAGGHSRALVAAHPSLDTLLGLDVDPTALRRAGPTLAAGAPTLRTSLVCANYAQLADVAAAAATGWGDEQVQYDGILMDLGCSSMQLDQAGRGFSFLRDGPLDMRMAMAGSVSATTNRVEKLEGRSQEDTFARSDPGSLSVGYSVLDEAGKLVPAVEEPSTVAVEWGRDSGSRFTAADIVNRYSEDELGRVLREYGEDWRRWRADAKAIVTARQNAPIRTTFDLLRALGMHVQGAQENGSDSSACNKRNTGTSNRVKRRKWGAHPATRAFQALRIEVNDELRCLSTALPMAASLLAPGGRLVVISFHPGEDRIVKHTFKNFVAATKDAKRLAERKQRLRRQQQQHGERSGETDETVTRLSSEAPHGHHFEVPAEWKRPVLPTKEEVAENPRSRSAKASCTTTLQRR